MFDTTLHIADPKQSNTFITPPPPVTAVIEPTPFPTVEIEMLNGSPLDDRHIQLLIDRLSSGWHVAFEAVVPLGNSLRHIVRLERPIDRSQFITRPEKPTEPPAPAPQPAPVPAAPKPEPLRVPEPAPELEPAAAKQQIPVNVPGEVPLSKVEQAEKRGKIVTIVKATRQLGNFYWRLYAEGDDVGRYCIKTEDLRDCAGKIRQQLEGMQPDGKPLEVRWMALPREKFGMLHSMNEMIIICRLEPSFSQAKSIA